MAIDTAEKRYSMMNFGDGTSLHLLPEPDAAVDLDDMQHLLDCYSGIAFASAGGATSVGTQTITFGGGFQVYG